MKKKSRDQFLANKEEQGSRKQHSKKMRRKQKKGKDERPPKQRDLDSFV